MRLALAMTTLPLDVPAELVEELRAQLGEGGLVELAAIVAAENFRARFNRVFGVESHGFAERAPEVAGALGLTSSEETG